jgi:integrase/recombinase XerD
VKSQELEAFLEYIAVIKALSKNTLLAYENDLVEFETFIKKPCIEAESEDVLSFLSSFENGFTLNRKLSSINSFFDFCFSQDWVSDKPLLKHSKLPRSLPKFLEYEFILDSLAKIDKKTWLGLRDEAFILFLYASGCRVSEALSVKYSDIEDGWLRIRSAKGDKERMVPLASKALEGIERYLAARPFKSEYIWLNYRGERLSRISAFKITQRYLGASPHTLRHSFASSLIVGGADLVIVQELLGHSSINTTQIYTHIKKQNLRDTILDYHPLKSEIKI